MKQIIDRPKMVITRLAYNPKYAPQGLPEIDGLIEYSLIKTQREFEFLMKNKNRKIITIRNFEDRK